MLADICTDAVKNRAQQVTALRERVGCCRRM